MANLLHQCSILFWDQEAWKNSNACLQRSLLAARVLQVSQPDHLRQEGESQQVQPQACAMPRATLLLHVPQLFDALGHQAPPGQRHLQGLQVLQGHHVQLKQSSRGQIVKAQLRACDSTQLVLARGSTRISHILLESLALEFRAFVVIQGILLYLL